MTENLTELYASDALITFKGSTKVGTKMAKVVLLTEKIFWQLKNVINFTVLQ